MLEQVIEGYRLSPQQRRLWLLSEQSRSPLALNAQCVVLIEGNLDHDRLASALAAIAERHEILRTVIKQLPDVDVPVQVITEGRISIESEYDLRGLDRLRQEEELEQVLVRARQSTEADGDANFRVSLVTLGDDRHAMVLTVPAFCNDAAGMNQLVRELIELYGARLNGEEPLQYADLAELQNELLESPETEAGRARWRQPELSDRLDVSLPGERITSALSSGFSADLFSISVDEAISKAARETAKSCGVAEASFWLACWESLIWRLAGEDEFVVGTGFDGRHQKELHHALGLLTRYLPLRARLESEMRFEQLLQQLDHQLAEAREWQEYFAWGDETEFCAACFDFSDTTETALPLSALRFSVVRQYACIDRFKIRLSCHRHGDSLRLELYFDENSYSRTAVERLAGNLMCLVQSALHAPETRILDLELLTGAEEKKLIEIGGERWSGESARCLHELFTEQAKMRGEATALRLGDQELSYRELERRATLLGRWLRQWGVQREELVGLLVEPSFELVVGMLGVLQAGAAYVPIDARYPAERVREVLEDSGVRVLLTQAGQAERLVTYPERVLCLDTDWEAIEEAAAGADAGEEGGRAEQLCYVIYTSGSTGKPKGVMVRHANVNRLISGTRAEFGFGAGDVWTLFHSPAFDFSVWEVWGALLTGGRLVIVPYLVSREPEVFYRLLVAERVTVLNQTPSAFWSLAGAVLEESEKQERLQLRVVIFGGEALPVQRLRSWWERNGTAGPRLVNMYGITETTVHVTWRELRASDLEEGAGSVIGAALPGWQVYVLDGQRRLAPLGVAGELYVGGAGVARGYLQRPELTAERFVPDPYSGESGGRLYRTGDLGRWRAAGELEYLGRIDRQVKIRGFRIELGEVEAVLAAQPAVREAVVMVRETAADKKLVAYFVAREGQAITSIELRQALREKLPEYMVPGAFVELERLPLTGNGKVDWSALPEPAEEAGTGAAAEWQGWGTPVEEVVAGIWSEVLGVGRVGQRDNFFELGGHSLLATQVVSRLRQALGVELELRVLFETPTVAGVSRAVEQELAAGREAAPPLKRVERAGELSLSFAQQRLWFLQQLEPDSSAYNIPLAIRLTGHLDVNALEHSITEVVRRHEVLRTTFGTIDGKPVQTIAESEPVPLPVTDLQHLRDKEREAETLRLAAVEAETPFNLAHGPLFRVRLIRSGDDDHVLIYTKHHIVSDGWSMAVLVRELGALYASFARGETSPLPELPIQYADFAQWQREWLTGDVLEAQLNYWREQLAETPALLKLPSDRPRSAIRANRGAVIEGTLSEELSGQLRDLGRREGATLYMVLLAAFQVLLSRYTGQQDIVVGTPIAGRTRPELENLIGFFINTLVMRAHVSEDQSFLELLRQVRETALTAYANQDVPFEKLVEEIQPERSLGHTPLFQVVFSMQNAPWRPLALPGLILTTLPSENETSKFDLVLNMWDSGSRIQSSLRYNTDLFDEATVTRLLSHLENLLQGIAANPSQNVLEISLLKHEERERLLFESNRSDADYPAQACVHHLFETQVERTPDATAVVFNDQRLSYSELNRRANQIAHHLRSIGAGRGAAVGVYLDHSIEMVAALLGVLKAGAAYVPLEPSHPPGRTNFMISDAGISVVLAHERLTSGLTTNDLTVVPLDSDFAFVSGQSEENVDHVVTASDLAYIIYTSGSTGVPKGVMIEHGALVNYVWWAKGVYVGERNLDFALYSSLAFDLTVTSIFTPLLQGGRVVIYDKAGSDFPLTRILEDDKIDVLKLTPSHFALIEDRDNHNTRIKRLIVGGEAFETTLARRMRDSFGAHVEIINEYGPTEATVGCMIHRFDAVRDERAAVPIGVPAANVQIYVLDRRLRPVAENVVGELYIGGAGLARGYLGRPELTAERFVPDPFSSVSGARLYRTGDMARRLERGVVEFLGRWDEQVKFHGYRVELGELRTALNRYPGVRDSVVVMRQDAGGRELLAAYYVARQEVPVGELRQYMLGEVVSEVVPQVFIHLRRLPLTLNGKINFEALPVPKLLRSELTFEYVGPRTPLEELVAGVWTEVLGVERVGVHDNFFELGGHSLLATQVISRLYNVCGVELPLRTLFEVPTIAGVAERISVARQAGTHTRRVALEKSDREGALLLSFAQQRLWFLQQLEPESYLYNIPVALRLRGPLDVAALEQSLNEVMRRHESLRTSFPSDGGQPRQMISAHEELQLAITDLSQLIEDERENELQRYALEESRRPFDLAHAPLQRVRLLRLADNEHVLFYTMHHIISDGWSMGVLLKEVSVLYRALSQKQAWLLPELPIQYADYAVWQRRWLEGEVLDEQLSYWKEQLAGAPPALDLPTDHPRPPVQTTNGAHVSLQLSEELSQRLKSLSREEGVTLFMTLLAGFQALLSRYSGQDDVVVGTPIAGRTRPEVEGLIGFFINTLVLRADLSGSPTFRELLGRVKQVCLDAYAHQDVPFEKLVEELQPDRDMSRSPLFQVVFMFAAAGREVVTLEGLEVEALGIGREAAKCDLTLELRERGKEIVGAMVYNTDLFDRATVERFCAHYVRLLEGEATASETSLSRLDLLTDEELRQLVAQPRQHFPVTKCLHELFSEQAKRTPQATALSFGDEQLSYAELDRRSAMVASRLRRWGVGSEQLVALLCEPSLELVVGMLGILKAGGAYLPIDARHPAERVRTVLADSGARVLLTQAELAERLLEYPEQVLCLDTEWAELEKEEPVEFEAGVSPSHLAYVIYTSGSTGMPKGVMVTHANVARLLAATQNDYGFDSRDTWTLFHSPAFDFSVWEVWGALLTGGRLLVVPHLVSRWPEVFYRLLVQEKVTVLNQTPSAFRVLSQVEETSGETSEQLEPNLEPLSLRLVIFGGEALELESLRGWFERHGTEQPRLVNMYGITETTVHVTYRPLSVADLGQASVIGEAIEDLQVYLLDGHGQPVPLGVPGELFVGGAGVARGYLGRPELTAERFVPDPFTGEPGARLYRSGDVGRRLANGELEYLGRADRQVKIRGFRMELGEIEAALLAQAEVREAVVLVHEETPDDKKLVAYVVAPEAHARTSIGLRKELRERLPEYMVPSTFVFLDRLPLTPNGKVDQRALMAPVPDEEKRAAEWIGPRTPIEEVVAGVWAEVLSVERVGVYDNFFELGGHSLLATQVMSRLREAFGVEMGLRALFEAPTVEGVSRELEQLLAEGRTAAPPIIPVAREGELPLSFAQQRMWFLQQIDPMSPVYNIFGTVRFGGPLNREALERSLQEVVRRHEVLRTTFPVIDGLPVQRISREGLKLEVIDLRQLPEDEREGEVKRTAEAEARRPFDLEVGPLCRVFLQRLSDEDHVLLYTMHHIVSDGWSMGVLLKEISTLYKAFSHDEESPLPDLPVQYADYAVWQRTWLTGEVLDEQLSYWRKQLGGAPPALDFPTDHPRPPVQSFRGANVSIDLPVELTRKLKELSRREGATLYMVLLAAFQALLSRYTGQAEIVVGTPIAGRTRPEVEELIGFFINTLVLRTDISGDPTFTELLRRVRRVCLEAYAHQDVPFERLVEELQPERDLSRSPLFQVMLVLQNAPVSGLEMADLELKSVQVETQTAKFDLILAVEEVGDAIVGKLVYCADLFERETAERFCADFRTLLEGITGTPLVPLSHVAGGLEFERRVDDQVNVRADRRETVQGETYIPARTNNERLLVALWTEVLKLNQVGIDDNFFELGGHSLLLVQLQNKMRKSLDPNVSIVDLFKFPTIRALAAHLEGEEMEDTKVEPDDERITARKTARKRQRAQRQSAGKHD